MTCSSHNRLWSSLVSSFWKVSTGWCQNSLSQSCRPNFHWQHCRAVMVLKPKPKTAVLRWNRTAVFWRPCDGFSRISKMAQPSQQSSPNNSLIIASAGLPPAPFEVTNWPGVELPDSLTTCRDKSTFVLLLAPSGLTRTYRWTPSHADKYVNGGGESRLIDVHVSMRVPVTDALFWSKLSLLGRPLAGDVGLTYLLLISAHDEGVMYRSLTFAVCRPRPRQIAIWTKCMIQCFPFVGLDHK